MKPTPYGKIDKDEVLDLGAFLVLRITAARSTCKKQVKGGETRRAGGGVCRHKCRHQGF